MEAAAPGDGDARAAEVARHLQRAGRDDLAGPRWQRAARHARTLGALPEAAAFWTEALRCDPDDAAARLELAEVHAWSGGPPPSRRSGRRRWPACSPADRLGAWCRRGLIFKTLICNPAASLAAYHRAEELLPRDAPAALRAQVLLGLAWNEAVLEDPERSEALLAEVAALVPDPDDDTVAEIETARLIAVIRLGRFAETEAVAPPRRRRSEPSGARRLRLRGLAQDGVRARLRRRLRGRAADGRARGRGRAGACPS